MGKEVYLFPARKEWDVVVVNRANGPMDSTIINAPGHVGFYHSHNKHKIYILGGNQSDSVNIIGVSRKRLLGIRRMYE
jgi:hypothetical protein